MILGVYQLSATNRNGPTKPLLLVSGAISWHEGLRLSISLSRVCEGVRLCYIEFYISVSIPAIATWDSP